jgi:hypothetical protein
MDNIESIEESNINEMDTIDPQESQNLDVIGDGEVGSINELIIKDDKTSTSIEVDLEYTKKAADALIGPTETLTEGGKRKKRTKKRRTKSKNSRKSRRQRKTIKK